MAQTKLRPLEELAEIDRKIWECERRISEQEQRIKLFKQRMGNGKEAEKLSENLYENLITSLSVLWELRELVRKEVEHEQR